MFVSRILLFFINKLFWDNAQGWCALLFLSFFVKIGTPDLHTCTRSVRQSLMATIIFSNGNLHTSLLQVTFNILENHTKKKGNILANHTFQFHFNKNHTVHERSEGNVPQHRKS